MKKIKTCISDKFTEWAEKGVIFLPTDTTYISILHPKWDTDTLHTIHQEHIQPWMIIESAEVAIAYFQDMQDITAFLLRCLSPGPIQFQILDPLINRIIQVYIPHSDDIQSLIHQVGGVAYGYPAAIPHWPPATTIDMLADYFDLDSYPYIIGECKYSIEPTWLDTTNGACFKILRPGPIQGNQIRQLLPSKINLVHTYKNHFWWKKTLISEPSEHLITSNECAHSSQSQNEIHIGSQTNPQLMAKKVLEHIWHIKNKGLSVGFNAPQGKNIFLHAMRFAVGRYSV